MLCCCIIISPPRRRWLRHAVNVLTWLGVVAPMQAEAVPRERRELVIAVSDDGQTTRKIVGDLRKRFPRAQISDSNAPSMRKAMVIAVGPAALRNVLTQGVEGPVVSVFTSSQVYHAVLDAAEEALPAVTAIYAEPAPIAQLRLIHLLFQRQVRTTAVLGGRSSLLEPMLRRAAAAAKIPLVIETYGPDDSISRVLSRSEKSPVILATPDNAVYTSENLRAILLTTYRNGQAVIGFSAALVRAGSLATTYSDVEDIGAQLEEVVGEVESTGRVPEPQYPKYFRTVINEDVARSLNIVVDDTARSFANKPEKR